MNIMNWIPAFAGMTFQSYRQLTNGIGITSRPRLRREELAITGRWLLDHFFFQRRGPEIDYVFAFVFPGIHPDNLIRLDSFHCEGM
jgi:hypothetical protein